MERCRTFLGERASSRSVLTSSRLVSTAHFDRLANLNEHSADKKRKRLRSDDAQADSASPRAPLKMPTEKGVRRQELCDRGSSQDFESIEYLDTSDDTLIAVAQEVPLDDSEDHQLLLAGDRYWFEDGNVILVAGDTQFRVYQGLLAAQSPVLAHIFSSSSLLVDTSTAEEIGSDPGDPCLVIHLSDSPEDLRHMLRLFMPSALLATGPSFEFVSACIRLGLKYEIKQIYDTALAILKSRYTDNFDHWDSLGSRASRTGFDDIHAIGVVNLARLIGDSTMLPVALWQCCRLGSDLVRGFAREDGTRENLTMDDLGLCFAAQERLIKAGVRARLRVFSPTVSEKCQNAAKCKEVFVKALRSLEKKVDIIAGTDPFVPYTRICLEGVLGLCSTCSSEVKARDQKERRAIWNRLPALLGIEVPRWGKVAGAKAG